MRCNQLFIYLILSCILSGCFFIEEKQDDVRNFINAAEKNAPKTNDMSVSKDLSEALRSIDGSYNYQQELEDPFRARKFVVKKEQSSARRKIIGCKDKEQCPNAPVPHERMFLENYAIDVLSLVGVLDQSSKVALIRTPDTGTHMARRNEYIGQNNGKIISITENSVVVQEKVFKNGRWENKKAVLVLK